MYYLFNFFFSQHYYNLNEELKDLKIEDEVKKDIIKNLKSSNEAKKSLLR